MTTTIDITPLIEVLLTLLGAIIARYAVPYFKAMLTNAQQEHVRELVHIAVYAAKSCMAVVTGRKSSTMRSKFSRRMGLCWTKSV